TAAAHLAAFAALGLYLSTAHPTGRATLLAGTALLGACLAPVFSSAAAVLSPPVVWWNCLAPGRWTEAGLGLAVAGAAAALFGRLAHRRLRREADGARA